ncbi:hypothetical protein [Aromatoleum anaerobium]|uniref:Uncharacterized protein n=1 Tax=Aromatoleum anaerobium TaxID=182180 RepID=A0ABX1PLZ8_9RHOO|nr:hypothetical protein [Aromatoleum anaerobium]MCK0508037.1 hypothetical protein [Aromatoleum anaerobium]
MNRVIRLDEYRKEHSRPADAQRELWACGVCGEHVWTMTTSGRMCCARCNTLAANLRGVEQDVANGVHADTQGPATQPDDRPQTTASGQWWWGWGLQ